MRILGKGEQIMLSYYLRSGTGFERYLLILHNGKTLLKEKQDEQIKGFAPEAFFGI